MYAKRMKLYDEVRTYRARAKNQVVDVEKVKPNELKAMRYLRGAKPNVFSKLIGVPMDEMIAYENSEEDYVPKEIATRYVVALEILPNEHMRLRKLMNGETKEYERDRAIPFKTKKEVLERDNNKCTKCGSAETLQIHHVERFSKGGSHDVDNLVVLCVSCHAEEHKGEQGYHLLKAKVGE